MRIEGLTSQAGEWLRGTGSDCDIVISSRIRLARNVSHFPFTGRASRAQRRELQELLRDKILEANLADDMLYLEVSEMRPVEKLFLVERHLISREHANSEDECGVAFGKGEAVSIMVNEEDHLRMQAIQSGFELDRTWEIIDAVDDALERRISYAFSPKLGYLTACPTNVGTGMRISVMLHLPALAATRHLDKVVNAVAKINLVVRGLYGEGTQASGDFYQISNQITLGKSERDLIEDVRAVIPRIVTYERKAREALLKNSPKELEDRVWRACGILKTARCISSEETLHLLSQLRMGVNLKMVPNLDLKTVNELFVLALPAHLQKMRGHEMSSEERNIFRADFIRSRLASV